MTQAEARKIAGDRMERENQAHLKGQEVQADARLLGSTYDDYAVDAMEPVDPSLQGYDPKQERTEAPKPQERPKPMAAAQMLDRYYAASVFGKLNNVLSTRDAMGGDCGDEGQAVIRYVDGVMGAAKATLRPIILHRMGGYAWAQWYGTPSRSLASHLFGDFVRLLDDTLRVKPFTFDATPVYRSDHLEDADRANFLK